ncbi:polysaccharide deacetylase family protein [Marinobacter sp. 1Y8]
MKKNYSEYLYMVHQSDIIAFLGPFGLFRFAKYLTRKEPKLLMYHRFSDAPRDGFTSARAFEEQVAHIKKYYVPLTVSDIAKYIFDGKEMPSNVVAITIDDGYDDFYNVAWPILKKYEVPATFYVTTGFIDGDLWLWPDKVKWLLERAPKGICPASCFNIKVGKENYSTVMFDVIARHLLSLPDAQKHSAIDSASRGCGLELPRLAPKGFEPCGWVQLETLQNGGVEIGGHTYSHPSLGRVELQQAKNEVIGCRDRLQSKLGTRVRSFCYPNGMPSDYSRELEALVAKSGFSAAVVAYSDSQGTRNRYALRRHSSGEGRFQFDKSVSGVELIGHRIRNTILVPN